VLIKARFKGSIIRLIKTAESLLLCVWTIFSYS
jgi:hypothetical protein